MGLWLRLKMGLILAIGFGWRMFLLTGLRWCHPNDKSLKKKKFNASFDFNWRLGGAVVEAKDGEDFIHSLY